MNAREAGWVIIALPQALAGGLLASLVVVAALIALPIALITMPLWIPVHVCFGKFWHAEERAQRATAELATRNLLDQFDDPHRRKRGQWWG